MYKRSRHWSQQIKKIKTKHKKVENVVITENPLIVYELIPKTEKTIVQKYHTNNSHFYNKSKNKRKQKIFWNIPQT